MSSDRARVTYDPSRHYTGVVAQQGRVSLEADWNEAQAISGVQIEARTLDFIGRAASPDRGYRITPALDGKRPTGDLRVHCGTLYLGGQRLSIHRDLIDSDQPDWADHQDDPLWGKHEIPDQPHELVYLLAREQEVSAVEDRALRDVALGGPDTSQRLRILQRVIRHPTGAATWEVAWGDVIDQHWIPDGFRPDRDTRRLEPEALLQVKGDPANGGEKPVDQGTYLGPDNQLIRVQIARERGGNKRVLIWGYDNASFLYRLSNSSSDPESNTSTMRLATPPVDAYHQPRVGQIVEVLRSAVLLTDGDSIAASTGEVVKVTAYDPDTRKVVVDRALPDAYQRSKANDPPLYLRVWQGEVSGELGEYHPLLKTGISVRLTKPKDPCPDQYPVGAYWMIALRPGVGPNSPGLVYPQRIVDDPQPPDGPRQWLAPLAFVRWHPDPRETQDLVPRFQDLAREERSDGRVVRVHPEDVGEGWELQDLINTHTSRGCTTTICLEPGTYLLPRPLWIGPQHGRLTLRAARPGVELRAMLEQAEPDQAKPDQAKPEQAKPEQAEREQAEPDQAKPEQAEPDQAKPEQAEREQAEPDQAKPDQAKPDPAAQFLLGLIIARDADGFCLEGLDIHPTHTRFVLDHDTYAKQPEPARAVLAAHTRRAISIGLHAARCTNLTVRDCRFVMSLPALPADDHAGHPPHGEQDLFGAGIFGAEELRGLRVEGCTFVVRHGRGWSEPIAHARSHPDRGDAVEGRHHVALGFAQVPSAIAVPLRKPGDDDGKASTEPCGSVSVPLLDDAVFRGNLFEHLTAPVVVVGQIGVLRADSNTARECHAGFWLVTQQASHVLTMLDRLVNQRDDLYRDLVDHHLTALAEPLLLHTTVLARTLPRELSEDLDAGASPRHLEAPSTVDDNRATEFTTQLKAAGSRKKPEPVDVQQRETWWHKWRERLRGGQKIREEPVEVAVPPGAVLRCCIDMAENNLQADSAPALVVLDTAQDSKASLILTGNRLSSHLRPGATAGLYLLRACTATANVIVNGEREDDDDDDDGDDDAASLLVLPLYHHRRHQAAITGNVLIGEAHLPDRPDEPDNKLPSWVSLNSVTR
jgi:hypothetical protein